MSMSLRGISQRVVPDDRLGFRQLHPPTHLCQGKRINAEVDLSSAMVASFAAVSMLCSVEAPALAEEAVQGGVFESLGFESPATVSKKGVQLSKQKLKSAFGPAPEVSPPSAPKESAPLSPPPPPAPKAKTKSTPAPVSKPSFGRKKIFEESKPITPEKKPPVKAAPVPTSKPAAPIALPSIKAPEVKLPEFKAPELPSLSASSRDAAEAGAVLAFEVLLALIASSAVNGLLKKA